jgi:hypothetical protein
VKYFDAIIIGTGQGGPSLAARFAAAGMAWDHQPPVASSMAVYRKIPRRHRPAACGRVRPNSSPPHSAVIGPISVIHLLRSGHRGERQVSELGAPPDVAGGILVTLIE